MKTTKYMGFIIEINKNIIMDPTKIEIIIKWEIFKTVKKVKGSWNLLVFTANLLRKSQAGNAFNEFNNKKHEILRSKTTNEFFSKLK